VTNGSGGEDKNTSYNRSQEELYCKGDSVASGVHYAGARAKEGLEEQKTNREVEGSSHSGDSEVLVSLGVDVRKAIEVLGKDDKSDGGKSDGRHHQLEAESPLSAVSDSVSQDESQGGKEIVRDTCGGLVGQVVCGETSVGDGVSLPYGLDQRYCSVENSRERILILPGSLEEGMEIVERIREGSSIGYLLVVEEPYSLEASKDGEGDHEESNGKLLEQTQRMDRAGRNRFAVYLYLGGRCGGRCRCLLLSVCLSSFRHFKKCS